MSWQIYTGQSSRKSEVKIPPPPPWRELKNWSEQRARAWQPTAQEVELVNAALVLRRPLLVSGPPGSGKSSLAYAVAAELNLGVVLNWPVNSRSTRDEGLYLYDAVGRLRDATLARQSTEDTKEPALADYIQLGPLGTALALSKDQRPRVLLLDEIDKADIDLPNDLLHVLDEGRFEIPELARHAGSDDVYVRTADDNHKASVKHGRVQAEEFPFVVLTSNGERDLPPAFLRRCLRLDIETPRKERLEGILRAHLKEAMDKSPDDVKAIVEQFEAMLDKQKTVAVDQLLNAVFLVTRSPRPEGEAWNTVLQAVLRALEER